MLTTVLFGTCTTQLSFQDCTSNLAAFSSQLSTSCAKELSDNNDLVTSTQTALLAYPIVRNAGCLEDQVSGAYCYVDAVHAANPSDLYLYQLSLGTPMPNGTTPSCSACAGSILGVYAGALQGQLTNGSTKALAKTYDSAASGAVRTCGSGFAVVGLTSGALPVLPKVSMWSLGWYSAVAAASMWIAFV